MSETKPQKSLALRVREAWGDYDKCPDFGPILQAILACIEKLENYNDVTPQDVDKVLASLRSALPKEDM